MKRIFAVLMMSLMLISVLSMAVSAEGSFDTGNTVYNIPEAAEISFSYTGVTGVTAVPQKDSTLENLIDGDAVKDVAAFDTHGVVLVCNDYIKPTYEAQGNQKTEQSIDAIPKVHFTIKYEEKTTFDALYLSLFQEINHMIATPGGNLVVVESSDNGKDWKSVGTYYYRPHIVEYTGDHHAGNVEELVVPLGKEVKSTYVRMTFDFALVPEITPPHYWTYYSNVYEWMGFTELGVAKYKSGDTPKVMTEEEANTPDVVIDGTWVAKTDSLASLYKFEAGVYEKVVYGIADFEEMGTEADAVSEETGTYSVYINEVTITVGDNASVYTATVSEDGKVLLDDKFEKINLEAYTEKPSVDNSADVSEPADKDDSDDDNGVEYSKPVANNGAATNGSDDSDGLGTGVIIGIVVGAVALIAIIVVVVIILKKKKQ